MELIYNLQFDLTTFVLVVIIMATFAFMGRRSPTRQLLALGFVFGMILVFFLHLMAYAGMEQELMPVLIVFFMTFLLTFLSGVGIVKNLLENEKGK